MNRGTSKRIAYALGCLGLVAVYTVTWLGKPDAELAGFAQQNAGAAPETGQAPFFQSRFASSDLKNFAHASAIAELPNGNLLSVWFSGSREGAADVQIRGAIFDSNRGEWSSERVLATRESTQQGVQKYIRKLGNPVVVVTPDERLWLFYVSVSVGGWGGSSINAMYSDDLGDSWSSPRQLVTSPFLNISTLVRGAPIMHADGSIGLPIYHEFLGKFAEYLYLDRNGVVVDKFRISHGNHSLQPSVVPLGERTAVALLRYAGDELHRVLASRTEDGGKTWSTPVPLTPNNPNSSLAAIVTPRHGLLVALNDLVDGRFRLSLYGADVQLQKWTPLLDLDRAPDPKITPMKGPDFQKLVRDYFQTAGMAHEGMDDMVNSLVRRICKYGTCDPTYDYPYVIRDTAGRYHLVYSWNHSFIKHVSFNDAWLEQQL